MTGNKEKRRGSIVIFTLFVLALVMSISFAILAIFIPKLKIASESIGSTIAAYAADSAIEWCLYSQRGNPNPPPKPTSIGGATVEIKYGSAVATCSTAEKPLNHSAIGTYYNVARSFEITQ
ncbi:MAG: hypothetical protein A3B99_03005 [Candidatus Yanofskybacteria bacterium RIFCSPHIGHO2_02_FULL_44_12b]|uniref:Uncharacterized protein n=2 Tax=Candidatus Yanofskyibacteriota TaxID=1752733 RepID=A0A1F8GMD3_9BACT|nr:MAG: hypothetical protein UW79_C0005G0036 [Candidatus Yanofskybacteria bacterium GW2011_GWA2_44_9]OGN05493.1 MAG: hypothetical protein A2659_02780 [Candidatus Yanofskybacteria bacterium RIFCSPHIGHO2_01_FULL_44_24]OGN15044.1 MAG: hypothetical protein A3B99_03005 [Candidatus Yanofskybacteria bacterium RIFCSPHIGHO2_02_FULL_44_12b]OGN26513.1 MAG: hypothetical protein A2925_03150 [Candidatus Yanofskybacteria bacterium RIFCSPLOWO2_01_FULL_44_22]